MLISVDKCTIENLQKDSTLKKCFDQVGKPIIREKLCWRVLHEEWITLSETSRDEDRTKQQVMSVNHESAFSGHL